MGASATGVVAGTSGSTAGVAGGTFGAEGIVAVTLLAVVDVVAGGGATAAATGCCCCWDAGGGAVCDVDGGMGEVVLVVVAGVFIMSCDKTSSTCASKSRVTIP